MGRSSTERCHLESNVKYIELCSFKNRWLRRKKIGSFTLQFPSYRPPAHMASQQKSSISTRASNKKAHPGRPDLPPPRRPTETVQAKKAAKIAVNAQKAAEIQAGIQRAAEIEDSLAVRASNHAQQFKKPTTALLRKATWSNEEPLSQSEVVSTAQGSEDGTMPQQGE